MLLVDDDPVSRTVLRIMLERLELSVTEADSVASASAVVDVDSLDLVICDYAMPEANGLDLLGAFPELGDRFVLLTGTRERDDLGDERVEHVAAYVTKPVSSDELHRLVDAMLNTSTSA